MTTDMPKEPGKSVQSMCIKLCIKNYRQLKMPRVREMVFPKEEHINCLW